MASNQNSYQKRKNRKFPHINNRNNQSADGSTPTSSFWLSFQESLLWLRKNEQTISKCVQLLQAHPNLIQDKSLDCFWEFLHPLLDQTNTVHIPAIVPQNGDNHNYRGHNMLERKTKRPSRKGVPSISVTETEEVRLQAPSISSSRARTPRVHLVSFHPPTRTATATSKKDYNQTVLSDHLHWGALRMLQDNFFVRTANPADRPISKTAQDNTLIKFKLSESDVCVYLFNDKTIDDKLCFHDLCTAIALKIPVVYVRHHTQELPKTFAESITRNSRGCASLGDYIDKHILGTYEDRSSSTEKSKAAVRRNKILPPFTSRTTRSKSASDLNPKTTNVTHGSKKHKASKTSIYETELLLYLINSFKNSYIFDENDLEGSSQHLRQGIYYSIGIIETEVPPVCDNSSQYHKSKSKKMPTDNPTVGKGKTTKLSREHLDDTESNYLRVPDADNLLLAREWSHSGSVSAPPCDDLVHDDHFNFDFRSVSPAPLEQKSTTYLVFDHSNTTNKFRRVHFPSDDSELTETCSDMESDEFDPRGSPINFPDIDLARDVNELIDNSEFD